MILSFVRSVQSVITSFLAVRNKQTNSNSRFYFSDTLCGRIWTIRYAFEIFICIGITGVVSLIWNQILTGLTSNYYIIIGIMITESVCALSITIVVWLYILYVGQSTVDISTTVIPGISTWVLHSGCVNVSVRFSANTVDGVISWCCMICISPWKWGWVLVVNCAVPIFLCPKF